jgi:hypothetical protein
MTSVKKKPPYQFKQVNLDVLSLLGSQFGPCQFD